MADQADVETTLVGQIQQILYPNGASTSSAIGPVCRVYRGWPLTASLNADLLAGVINISVLPVANSIKPLTAFNDGWIGTGAPPGMVATSFGQTVTFAGTAGSGQLAGLLIDGIPYVYRSVDGDTTVQVAANLAALVSADIPASSSGAAVSIPTASTVIGRTSAQVSLWMEIRRQRQSFSVMFWCPTPQLRDQVVALVDLNLAGIRFLALPDGSDGRLIFSDTVSQDQNQNAGIYRRDLIYHVEYATTQTMTTAEMLFGGLGINGATAYY